MQEFEQRRGFSTELTLAGQRLKEQSIEIAESFLRYPLSKSLEPVDLESRMESHSIDHLILLDSKVNGVEALPNSTRRSYGYEVQLAGGKQLTVVDHHVSDPELGEGISTGNLSLRYLEEHGGPRRKRRSLSRTKIVIV